MSDPIRPVLRGQKHDDEGVHEAIAKFDLWFFRDLIDDQRFRLFALFGKKAEEFNTRGKQQEVMCDILAAFTPTAESDHEGFVSARSVSPPLDPGRVDAKGTTDLVKVQANTGRLLELMRDRPADRVSLSYTNRRGETAVRELHLVRIWYGATDRYPESQLLLSAFDYERDAYLDFAVIGFRFDNATNKLTGGDHG